MKQDYYSLITLILFSVSILIVGCKGQHSSDSRTETTPPASKTEVVHFCGDCHAYPEPETFPVAMWREEVEQGYRFYERSRRTDLKPPELEAVVSYYEQNAPEEIQLELAEPVERTSPIEFLESKFDRDDTPLPAISHISVATSKENSFDKLMVTDMRSGTISQFYFKDGQPRVETVGELPHPAHAHPGDLDGNGERDWVISDLGSFEPEDHSDGLVGWLEVPSGNADVLSEVIFDDVGRVADARSADFDGDGDQDVVVAVFGWRETGKLIWLEQLPPKGAELQFQEHLLSDRHGVSHVPVVDIDRDGDLDIVALFTQEFESIEAYLNNGSGKFENKVIYKADDPSYGSSSIDVTDLDNDNDWDILYTNGDSLDSHLLKPYHSVQWLEQTDGFEFAHHEITKMPGAYCVKAGDMDGDGDQDLVASSMTLNFNHPFYSLIWLEQVEGKKFQRHNLESGIRQHACIALGDFDADNDLDIAVGHFEPRPVERSDWLSIWWNEGKRTE